MNTKNGYRFIFIASLAGLVCGCTTSAKPQNFYPIVNDPPWVFSGSLHGTNGDINITVNDQIIMQGVIAAFSEKITLNGSYKGKEIKSICSFQYCSGGIQCSVFVNEKPAVLLDFSGL
jgi:hypothetical protein